MLRAAMAMLCGLLMNGSFASAKDLTNRLGLGVKEDNSQNIPEVATVFWMKPDFALTGGVGMDTETNNSSFVVDAGVRRVLFREDNMNFYYGGRLGIVNYTIDDVSTSDTNTKESGFEIAALFGGEFFLPGLESLGFTFEGGVSVISLKDVRFKTVAETPLTAGIIFYF